eukprot:gene20460-25082_t
MKPPAFRPTALMDAADLQWNNEESKYVEDELALEFPAIAGAIIVAVVRGAMRTVLPDDGRYRLFATARRNLAQ